MGYWNFMKFYGVVPISYGYQCIKFYADILLGYKVIGQNVLQNHTF